MSVMSVARAKRRLEKYRADRGSLEAINNLWFSLNEMLAELEAVKAREDVAKSLLRNSGWADAVIEANLAAVLKPTAEEGT